MSNPNAALMTVADKTGLKEFGDGLHELGWDIFAGTEGTKSALRPGLSKGGYQDILFRDSDFRRMAFNHSREVMAGLVATMILDCDRYYAVDDCVPNIGMLCINLATSNPESDDATDERPHLDWGGPALLSAGIKSNLLVVTNPDQYDFVLDRLTVGSPVETQHLKQALNSSAADLFQRHWADLIDPLGSFPAR